MNSRRAMWDIIVRNVKNRESSISCSSQFFANTDKILMLGAFPLELHIPILFVEIEFYFMVLLVIM